MNTPITQGVHHIGLTVSKLEESADFFTATLGWKEIKRNQDYPAIYVSDGTILLSLWQARAEHPSEFDKHRNIGLHHVAFAVSSQNGLNHLHTTLMRSGTPIEFAPELLGQGPARHMMCREPGGIRVEFIWPGK
jgi:catechol 2,3-dioxygenase-like lactoylglutathione lyase family enzyme